MSKVPFQTAGTLIRYGAPLISPERSRGTTGALARGATGAFACVTGKEKVNEITIPIAASRKATDLVEALIGVLLLQKSWRGEARRSISHLVYKLYKWAFAQGWLSTGNATNRSWRDFEMTRLG